ncbi:MAG: hypothetical protein PF482_00090 [Desulfobacteraceae bacterium]|nr:hypothetical protein [Desulfobacteraceae bacterium]
MNDKNTIDIPQVDIVLWGATGFVGNAFDAQLCEKFFKFKAGII